MALTCRVASRISLDALGGHAAEAERLELEGHLAICERCRDEHAASLGLVRGLAAMVPESLPASAEQEVRQALASWRPSTRAPARRYPRRIRLLSGVVLAAAAIACFLIWRGRAYEIAGGDVVATSQKAADGQHTVDLRSERGGSVRIAEATVELGPATEVVWHKQRRVAELRRGRVTVDVFHRDGQYFAVRTARFTVEVVGTRFTVDATGVRTERGAVRVLRPDGSLAARVDAGRTWRVDEPTPGQTAKLDANPPPAPASLPVALEPAHRSPGASPGSGLAGARRALARGDAQMARRLAEALFHQGRDVAVEARIIFAESFLAEGRYADAIDGYRIVTRDFPTTSQAEISQFAIAQLQAEHGSGGQARAALQAYLTQYPHGRFAKEATSRLSRLAVRDR